MALDREALLTALFTRLQGIQGVVTVSRKPKTFDQVSPAEHPAIYMVTESQEAVNQKGLPPVWKLKVTVYLYVYDSSDAGPESLLNTYIKSIEACLEQQPGEARAANPRYPVDPYAKTTTLGGLASHCWISGPVETDGGGLGNQAAAIIPIEIMSA